MSLSEQDVASADAVDVGTEPEDARKPLMSSRSIALMNMGFFGVSISGGLQQTAITPLFAMLGAQPESLPILNMAGPITGLLIQPMIGVLSDRTWHPRFGRRKPYFVGGTLLFALVLFLFPLVSAVWMAVLLLWLMDAGNNTAMEPYRALIADKLRLSQRTKGYLIQGVCIASGSVLANLALFVCQKTVTGINSSGVPHWVFVVFWLGAVLSLTTVLISALSTKEIPPSPEELAKVKSEPKNPIAVFTEIGGAVREMPMGMHKLGLVYAFQWYGLFVYWQFASLSIGKVIFHAGPEDPGFQDAVGWLGLVNGFTAIIAAVASIGLIPLATRFGAKRVHAAALCIAGIGLTIWPHIDDKFLMFLPLIGFGIASASYTSLPYVMATSMVPKERIGVYLGILNMMIVVPQLIETATFGWVYKHLLGSNPVNAMMFTGLFFILGAAAALWVNSPKADDESPIMPFGSPRRISSVYNRVIVGTDGTDASRFTVGEAAEVASAAEARLIVVSAYDANAGASGAADARALQGGRVIRGKEDAEAAIETSIKELTKDRFKRIEGRAVAGKPAEAILEVAGDNPDNLIVVGNQGLGSTDGDALGSIPLEVARAARCNVMIVQASADHRVMTPGQST